MKLELQQPFQRAWQNNDAFEQVKQLDGKVYRAKEGRRTVQFVFANASWFLKYHAGIGWKEIFKNLLQLRLPVLGASNEFNAANKLQQLGVDTLKPVAFGQRGVNPAKQESFIICEDLADTISLENICKTWIENPPPAKLKKRVIKKIAAITRTMHSNGINHRDYYICHFLLPNNYQQLLLNDNWQQTPFYLIDLHRCQIRKRVPQRWLEKDLAGLFYSAMDAGLTWRDIRTFISIYHRGSPNKKLDYQTIKQKALALYQKDFGALPKGMASYE